MRWMVGGGLQSMYFGGCTISGDGQEWVDLGCERQKVANSEDSSKEVKNGVEWLRKVNAEAESFARPVSAINDACRLVSMFNQISSEE